MFLQTLEVKNMQYRNRIFSHVSSAQSSLTVSSLVSVDTIYFSEDGKGMTYALPQIIPMSSYKNSQSTTARQL